MMTKTAKAAILFIMTSILQGPFRVQAAFLPLFFVLAACSPKEHSIPDPPPTPPLSRPIVGYGVVKASYTRIMSEPGPEGVSLGYVRERTVLYILERRLVRNGESPEYWVRVERDYSGWLPENVIDIYDTEEKADTAAGRSGEGG